MGLAHILLSVNLLMVFINSRKIINSIANIKLKNVVHLLMKDIAHMEIDVISYIAKVKKIIYIKIIKLDNLTMNFSQ